MALRCPATALVDHAAGTTEIKQQACGEMKDKASRLPLVRTNIVSVTVVAVGVKLAVV